MISRNCRYNGASPLCDSCSKISTDIDDLEWKELGAPYDLNSIMHLPSGFCPENMKPINNKFMKTKKNEIIQQSTKLSAEDIIGADSTYKNILF